MAGTNEVALGIAGVLGSEACPVPLPISFRGQTLADAGSIVIAILSECADANIPLTRVLMDAELHGEVEKRAPPSKFEIISNPDMDREVQFFRTK